MAWTTPRTWTDTELVTAAIMNPHIRDNLNAIGNHFRLRKSADESVTSSAALQDDNHLTHAIAANEVWIYQLGLWINTGGGGIKMQMTGPAGSTGITLVHYSVTAGAMGDATAATGATFIDAGSTFTNESVFASGTIVNGATPGTFRLQWAQSSSNATPSTILANSWMISHSSS